MTIRPFVEKDLPAVLAIERWSFRGDAWPASLFREYAARNPDFFLVAEHGRAVVGYAVARLRAGRIELDSIAVQPRFRGRGYANLLMLRVMALAQAAHARSAGLTVRDTNTTAIRLYERLGFRKSRTIYRYYEDGSPGIRMTRSL